MERNVSENKCLGCVKSCCRDFKIAQQKHDPHAYRELLGRFPFIRVTGQELTLFNGREAVMSIHNCDRLQEDGSCKDYGVVERPQFCIDAGVKGAPHEGCLVFSKDMNGATEGEVR